MPDMPNLYGEAGSLLQGATAGVAQATRGAEGVADTKLKQQEIGQEALLKGQELTNKMAEGQADRKAEMDRAKLEAATRLKEQQMQTDRQFITLTPQMIAGANKHFPNFGFDSLKPGQKIQIEPWMGLITSAAKLDKLKPIKSSYVGKDGKEHTIVTAFNPETGDVKTEEISAGEPKPTSRGGGKGSGKSPEDRIVQYQKLLNDDVTSIQKYLFPSAGKSRKIPSQGTIAKWFSGKTGGALGDLSDEEKATLGFLSQRATQIKTNLANLNAAQRESGREQTGLPPETQKLIGMFGSSGEEEFPKWMKDNDANRKWWASLTDEQKAAANKKHGQ